MKRGRGLPAVVLVALCAAACDPGGPPHAAPVDTGASPNASIQPAPLVTALPELPDAGAADAQPIQGIPADSAGRLLVPDAGGPPPEPMQPDAPLTAEAPGSRELAGMVLEGVWRWRDVPGANKAPEVSSEGLKDAQKLTSLAWKIEIADSGRMRVEFASRALPLPARTELRARHDRYGTLVLWPNSTQYRVVAPGALRTVLGERRVDVTPLATSVASSPQGEGKRLGVPVRRLELTSNLGSLRLELAKVAEAGEGGALLCRALVEIGGVDPKTPVCAAGELVLSAAYAWQGGGGTTFEITSMAKRADLDPTQFLVPPPGAAYAAHGLPETPSGIFLTREELAAFRTAPLPPFPHADRSAPGEGLVAVNVSDAPMYLLVDGIPVAQVPANAERYLIGPPRGRYVVQWRTFLGERILPPQTVEVPARLDNAPADAGVVDGG